MKVPPLPAPQLFRVWKQHVRDEIGGASGSPEAGFRWILEVENPRLSLDDLYDSGEFPSLDAKLSAACAQILVGDVGRKVGLLKEQYALKQRLLKGRQVMRLIHDHYRVPAEEVSIMNFQSLLNVHMSGNDLKTFMDDWDQVMMTLETPQDERLLETLFRNQVENHPGIREHIAHYQRCEVGHPDRCYQYLVRIVRQHIDSRRQLQTKKELERGRSTTSMAMPAGEGNKGHCFQWMKNGSCRHGNECSYLHEPGKKGPTQGQKAKGTGKGSQHSFRGRSPSQEAGQGYRSASVVRKPCRFWLKGSCKLGDTCRFEHDRSGTGATPSRDTHPRENPGKRQRSHSPPVGKSGKSSRESVAAVFILASPSNRVVTISDDVECFVFDLAFGHCFDIETTQNNDFLRQRAKNRRAAKQSDPYRFAVPVVKIQVRQACKYSNA